LLVRRLATLEEAYQNKMKEEGEAGKDASAGHGADL
jgi:hypothetical protein